MAKTERFGVRERLKRSVGSLLLFAGTATAIGSIVDINQGDSVSQAYQQITDVRSELEKIHGVRFKCVGSPGGLFGHITICDYEVVGNPQQEERQKIIRGYVDDMTVKQKEILSGVNEEDKKRHNRDSLFTLVGFLSAATGAGILGIRRRI